MHRLSLLIVVFLLVFPASSSALTAPVLSLDDGTPAMRDAYGSSLLTVEGDLLVGETSGFSNTGMIHVLRRNDRGSWDVIQTLTSPDAAIGDRFGQLTAHNAGTLVVSSPGALGGQGAVYAYRRDVDGQWE